jgi:hypothetical protein
MEKNREYWRKHLTITGIVLLAWVILTAFTGYYRHEGLPVLYAVLIGLYAWYLKRQDRIPGG